MTTEDPADLLDRVTDETSFLAFIKALERDARENKETWQNTTIGDYLESATAWAEATGFGTSQGLSKGRPVTPFRGLSRKATKIVDTSRLSD